MKKFSIVLLLALGASGCDPIKKSVLQTDKSVEKLAVAMKGRAGNAGAIQKLTSADIDAFMEQRDKLVVVDFYADWCGPCKRLAPMLDSLAIEYGDRVAVGKVDIDAHRDLALRFGVRGIPDMRFYRDGKQVDKIVGLPEESELRSRFEQHLAGVVTAPVKERVPKEPVIQPMKKDWIAPGMERKGG